MRTSQTQILDFMTPLPNTHIGTAGWTLPKPHAHRFPAPTESEKLTHLQRYATTLNCVEINSSFHRPHQRKTWERWATSTPPSFRFAVKLPKTITHTAKLHNTGALLQTFLDQAAGLGSKLGLLLIQLPPSLAFNEAVVHEFLTTLRELHAPPTVLEPRHPTWFTPIADRLLRDFDIARAAADPPKGSPLAATPGGAKTLRYYRLHGAPRTYYSNYTEAHLAALAPTLHHPNTWVIFDNTALGHATSNALQLAALLRP
jgi:uncharacterized protein YecE (DUF72 family)